jgi:hypothetical protein
VRRKSQQSRRHAGTDCRHPGPQDASGHIHVNLGSGSPCRNDGVDKIFAKVEVKVHHDLRFSWKL